MQFYPFKGYLDIGISDFGNGLLQSYLNSPKPYPEVINDQTAIEAALEQKSTKDQAISRGYGLKTAREIVCNSLAGKIKGSFFVWSGNGYFTKNGLEKEIYGALPYYWPGSLTLMRVPDSVPPGFNLTTLTNRN